MIPIPIPRQVADAAAAYAAFVATRRSGRASPLLDRHAGLLLGALAGAAAPLSAVDIAERGLMPLSRPRIAHIFAELRTRGHVELARVTGAGRTARRFYRITPAGRAALAACPSVHPATRQQQ